MGGRGGETQRNVSERSSRLTEVKAKVKDAPDSLLDATASEGQTVVSVESVAGFTAGDVVLIKDDNANEINTIDSITTDLIMKYNLVILIRWRQMV